MTEYSNLGYNVDVYARLTINGQKVYCIDPCEIPSTEPEITQLLPWELILVMPN